MNGPLEWRYGTPLGPEERGLAVRAFDELRSSDLIRPTYADTVDPENWVTITDAGRQSLAKGALDDLDEALLRISPHLLEVRRGAWSAVASAQPDSLRQAAHSGRELIDQALKEGAPDAEVSVDPEFKSGSGRKSRFTRRDRLEFLMRKFRGEISESDLSIADKTIDLLLEIDNKLTAHSHARTAPQRTDVQDCLRMAESALSRTLLGR